MIEGFALTHMAQKNNTVSVPGLVEAGMYANGRNYIIEERKYGVHQTQRVINSLSTAASTNIIYNLAEFLHSLHFRLDPSKLVIPSSLIVEKDPEGTDKAGKINTYSSRGQISLIHSDLVPANILYNKDGGLAVIDWANATLAPCSYEFTKMQKTGEYSSDTMNLLSDAYLIICDHHARRELR
jgi:thiamine kinase-like enzyme